MHSSPAVAKPAVISNKSTVPESVLKRRKRNDVLAAAKSKKAAEDVKVCVLRFISVYFSKYLYYATLCVCSYCGFFFCHQKMQLSPVIRFLT